jgi:hypothetical protein
MHLPCHHSGARDEKSIGDEGASLATDGVAMALRRLIAARTGLVVETDRHQWAHSASCMVAMAWISAS